MYGAIIGDLAGSIYEFEQTKVITPVNPKELIAERAFYSDDTILTIAILEAIQNNKDYNHYLREYVKRYRDYKPDYKPYFKTAFSPRLIKWAESNTTGTSHGNGAMMRISPVGFLFDREEEVKENARLATIPSHNSKEAIDAATTIALIIYYLRKGLSKEEVFERLHIKPVYKPFQKFNTTCEETIGNCLFAFYHSHSFEDAIQKTLCMGGDTDTNCAIVGGMAEALYGVDEIYREKANQKLPEEFVKILKK